MLRKNDFLDERTGLTLSVVAYPHIDDKNGTATFNIGVSREAIKNGKIIKKVVIKGIDYNRNEDLYKQAYAVAKSQKTIKQWNDKTGELEDVVINEYFHDWEDEITE